MKTKIRFRHRAEYAGLRTIQVSFTILPIAWTGHIISGILRVLFRLCWPLKQETVSRVREVFGPETSIARCRYIARVSVWNMIMNFVEIFHAKKMDRDYLVKHLEGIDEAYARLQQVIDKHGGAVIALPHMGNWDLAGVTCSTYGFSLMAIGRPQNNPLVEKWMLANRFNFQSLDRRNSRAFVRIAHHLKSGGLFALLPDVRHNKPGVSVTVFGKPEVQFGKGLAKFARMANVPVVPFVMERLSADRHRINLFDPVLPDLEADADADAVRMTQAVWDIFERQIRAKPEQWFWHNRRWILTPLYTQTRKGK